MKNKLYTKSTTNGFTRWLLCAFVLLLSLFTVRVDAQLSGVKNIPGDYATLAAAITDLNTVGVIAPGVTLNLLGGNPETAPAGGYVIGGAGSLILTNTVASPITIQGNANTITANAAHTVGALNDGIFKIIGADFVTIDGFVMQENAGNTVTAAATNTMTEWGVALLYVTTTNGAQNNVIQNNNISLNRTYQNTFGIYSNSTHTLGAVTTSASATTAAGANSSLKVYGNNVNNVNNGIVIVGPTAGADAQTGIDVGGVGGAQSNIVTNYGTTGTFSGYANVSGTVNGILVRNSKEFNISFNTVSSSVGGVVAGTLNGIQVPAGSAAPTGTFTNFITNNNISLQSGVAAAMNGITYPSGSSSATSTLNVNNNNFNNFNYTVASSSTVTFITISSTNQFTSISSNTFTNISFNANHTGSVTFIAQSFTAPATGTKNTNSNSIVTGFTKAAAGGTVTFITDNGSTVSGAVSNCQNNNFSNVSLTGATSVTGINYTDGGTAPTRNVTGNTISNLTTGAATVNLMNLTYWNGTSTLSSNTLTNIAGQGAITGITIGNTVNTATSITVASNIINNLVSSGAGGSVTGITSSNTSTAINITNNSIGTLSTTAGSAVVGISTSGNTAYTITKNTICNLSGSNASSTVTGILVSAGTTININNNRVGDLRTPAANAANPLNGINLSSSTITTANVYFNSVYINASSTGALFGSSAFSVTSSATNPALTMSNNNYVNLSTSNGAGLAVASRRSISSYAAWNLSSNRNNYYASTIFTDGTNSPTTLAAYKTLVSTRDANAVNESPAYFSTTCGNAGFLKINTAIATALESGGVTIAGITDDFEGDVRGGTPDIGADEFAGIVLPACGGLTPGDAGAISGAASVCSGFGTSLNLVGSVVAAGLTYEWSASTTPGGPYSTLSSITKTQATGPLTSTTYYIVKITCTNDGSTATAAEKSVVVNANPAVSISSTSGVYCSPNGTPVTLTANNATSYSWAPSAGITPTTGSTVVATPSVSTTYTVVGTDGNGCTASASSTVNFSAGLSSVTPTATPSSICSGLNSVLNANAVVAANLVSNYTFSPSSGSYTTLSAPTNVFTGTWDDNGAISVPIGFSFTFAGNTYTSVNVYPNGYVSFGAIIATDYTPISTTAAGAGVIAGWGRDLQGQGTAPTGSVDYLSTGGVFTAQWSNTRRYNASTTNAERIEFQIQLHQTTNVVKIVYGTWSPAVGATSASLGQVGLRGSSNADFNNLSVAAGGNWAAPTAGGTNAATTYYNEATPATLPTSGQTYTYSPPSASSYAWSPSTFLSATTGDPVTATAMTSTTTYTVVASTAGGCTLSGTVTVNVGAALTCTAPTASGSPCAGSQTVTAHPAGGSPPFSYAWTEDGISILPTTQTITASTGTHTYNVQITDNCGLGCNAGNVIVTTNALPSVAVNPPTGLICNAGGTAVNLTASGAVNYTWSPAGGLSATTGANVSALPTASTVYTVTGTDANGCVATATASISVGNKPFYTLTPTLANICNGASQVITISDSYSGSFSGSGVSIPSSGTGTPYPATISVSGVPTGAKLKSVKIDGLTHTFPSDIDILLQSPTGINSIILSDIGGSTAITAVDIILQDGFPAIPTPPVTGTTYGPTNIDATDAFAAPGPGSVTDATPLLSSFNGNQNGTWNLFIVDDVGGDLGSISAWTLVFEVTPDPSVAYTWAPASGLDVTTGTTVTATPASSTVYTVTATVASGCSTTATSTINVGATLVCTPATATSPTCSNTNFTVTANVSGGGSPYTYSWSDGVGGVYPDAASITANLPAGTYNFTALVTDNCGASCSSSVSVTVNGLPSVSVSPSSANICLPNSTPVNLSASGAVSYTWSPASGLDQTTGSSVNANPSSTTVYTVSGTDANGCVNTSTATINAAFAVSVTNVTASPSSVCNGGVSSLSATAVLSPPPAPAYCDVSTSTLSTCITSVSINTLNSTGLTCTTHQETIPPTTATTTLIPGNTYALTVTFDASVTQAAAYFDWDRDGIFTNATEMYPLGTTSPTTINVTVPNVVSAGYAGMRIRIRGGTFLDACEQFFSGSTKDYNVALQSAASGLDYTWAPAASLASTTGNPVSTSALAATTTFTVTATSNGCSGTGTVTVNVGSPLVCGALTSSSPKCAGSNFTVTSNVSGGGAPYSYSWSDGVGGVYPNAASITANLGAGSYTFTALVTDACGSTCSSNINVTVNALPAVSVSPVNGQICNPGGAAITLTASNATSYTWSPSSGLSETTGSTVSANPTASTVYTVTGTDGNGCSNVATASIQVGITPVGVTASANPSTVCAGDFSQLSSTGSIPPPGPNTYSFSPSSGVFTSLSGGTNVSVIEDDDVISGALPIGFNFNYNGNTYSNVYASSNGFISFNSAAGSGVGNDLNAPAATLLPLIAPLWDDMDGFDAGGFASYQTSGLPGNQVFTFEWLNWEWNYSSNAATVNFQVKLYEIDSHIEFVYDDAGSAGTPAASTGASIGLAGTPVGTYLSLDGSGASPAASSSTSTNTITAKPASGQVYSFSPPPTGVTYSWAPSAGLKPNANVQNPETPALPAGTTIYTVTISSNGCSATATTSVTSGETLVCSAVTTSGALCSGGFTATAHHTGGGGPFTYSWSDGVGGVYPNSATVTVALAGGTYSLESVVTDNCGASCLSSVTVNVTQTPTAAIAEGGAVTVCTADLPYTLHASTDVGLTYQWFKNGVDIGGATASTLVITTNGSYTVLISNGPCNATSAPAVVTIQQTTAAPVVSPLNLTGCFGSPTSGDINGSCAGSQTITVNSGATGLPITWPASPGTQVAASSTLAVGGFPAGSTVTNVSVTVNLAHTWGGDIILSLQSPNGGPTEFVLNNDVNDPNINYGTSAGAGTTLPYTFNLSGVALPGSGDVSSPGPYLPQGAFAGFNGFDPNGVWTLTVSDDIGGDGGSLETFELTITASVPTTATWYDASIGGTLLATTSTFNPVANGAASNAVAGTVYDYYVECSDGVCPSSRTHVTYTVGPNYDDGDCSTIDACNPSNGTITHTPGGSCGVTLNSSIFIQGFYSGGGMMAITGEGCLSVIYNPGPDATDVLVDTVRIAAMNAACPYGLVEEQWGILQTNGTISVTFTGGVVAGNSYWLRITHRNSVETWSAAPVLLSAVTSYSFSSAASQAYVSNQFDLGDGNWAIITGDINRDGAVDGSDFLELDPSIQNGDGGYAIGDLNGDGAVDGSDFLVLDPNVQNGLGAAVPSCP